MNEPKRRGRPPKAKPEETVRFLAHLDGLSQSHPEYIAELNAEGPQAFAHVADALTDTSAEAQGMKDEFVSRRAQAYALRVWNGQSPDVPRSERIKRVAKALEGQGLSMEGVDL